MKRRSFVKAAALAGLTGEVALRPAHADVPDHRWDGYDFGWRPTVPDRLNQGPFGAGGDRTIHYTTPSDQPIKNYGLGLVGYTWEENGPSLAARAGTETLEQSVEKLAALPFMDVLYIRCDWRDVQKTPGRLDLNPVWKATLDAAKRHNLRVGFRVQLSSPNFQPKQVAIPDFLKEKVPLITIGKRPGRFGASRGSDFEYVEPKYDHPEFQKAFRELNVSFAASRAAWKSARYYFAMPYCSSILKNTSGSSSSQTESSAVSMTRSSRPGASIAKSVMRSSPLWPVVISRICVAPISAAVSRTEALA